MTVSIDRQEMASYPFAKFNSTLTGEELFLSDHVIQGQKILPGTAYLETARAALENAITVPKGHFIRLNECVFLRPVLVTEEKEISVQVYPSGGNSYGIEVSSSEGVHFQCKGSHHLASGQIENDRYIDLDELQTRISQDSLEPAAFYQNFSDKGIELGPSHQGIKRIKRTDREVLVWVNIPGSSKRGMAMDPGMLDGAITCASVLADNLSDGVQLPFAIKQIDIFKPLSDEMCGHIYARENGINFEFADLSGEVLVRIDGFVGRKLDDTSSQIVTFAPKWKADDLPELNAQHVVHIKSTGDYEKLVQHVLQEAKKLVLANQDNAWLVVELDDSNIGGRGILAGLRTIAKEHPRINVLVRQSGQKLQLINEAVQIDNNHEFTWRDSGCYLITGGAGGIGRLLAQEIASETESCKLVLLGRKSVSPGMRQFFNTLTKNGATVCYERCDITNPEEVSTVVAHYPKINGVFHCAGTIEDDYLVNKTMAQTKRVLGPKVAGLIALDNAMAAVKLDIFVTMSSIAGVTGNPGQFDYAAANGYMDDFIVHRQKRVSEGSRFGKSVSINWPLWRSDGMQLDEAARENLEQSMGLHAMPPEHGINLLKSVLASDLTQVLVLYGQKRAIHANFETQEKKTRPTKEPSRLEQVGDGDAQRLLKQLIENIKLITANHLKRKSPDLDETADWANFGFDSIMLSELVNRFNSHFKLSLMPTIFFETTNIKLFAEYLLENHATTVRQLLDMPSTAATSVKESLFDKTEHDDKEAFSNFATGFQQSYFSTTHFRSKDIAVIGMSCRIAGARNLEEFWQVLDEGRDMIQEIPADRWDWRDVPESRKWGSFVSGVSEFDSLLFGISPAEAIYINPEQRLILQYAWECLENAGCGGEVTKGSNTGIYVGCGASGYKSLLNAALPVEAYSATGEVTSVGPNRMSYLMDWHGPSNPVETACSSALVAVHRAVEAIRMGHCEQAIAGGVNLLLTPDAYISFSKAGMLAEDGRCKTFSAHANGYVRGEGVGMVMLKPLQAALEDGNKIYAVVKGSAENHGGRTNSLTAPNPKSQAAVIKKALKDANIDFSQIGYVECHGTGTPLGDPVEINGLKMVAKESKISPDSRNVCKLGSIKSNIGHLEFAAGIAGLIKVILQLQHRKIVRSLHSEEINPYIDLSGSHMQIAQEACDWDVEYGAVRIGGVSSFGFGGVNAHVILQEFNADTFMQNEEATESPQCCIFSATDKDRLLACLAPFPEFLTTVNTSSQTLSRIARTLQVGRTQLEERVVFVVSSVAELKAQIEQYISSRGYADALSVVSGNILDKDLDQTVDQAHIDQWLEKGKLHELAHAWVKGHPVPWL